MAPSNTGSILQVAHRIPRTPTYTEFLLECVSDQDPARDMASCPQIADCFYYATGPARTDDVAKLTQVSGLFYPDGIIIPTARLASYLVLSHPGMPLEAFLADAGTTGYHVESRHRKIHSFDPERDCAPSTERMSDRLAQLYT